MSRNEAASFISVRVSRTVWLCCHRGENAVAIPSATILPLEDLVTLRSYDLHMYPDQDEAGQLAFMELRSFFVNHYAMLKEEKLPEGVKDYCDYYRQTSQNEN